jgi:L-aminopeptidase/D-esterase-like protein
VALGIEDLAVGHWTDPVGLTGCTVAIPPPGNVAAASVRGGGPGTRETDLLQPQAHVEAVCAAATTADGPMGNVGAGMGATVGKAGGPEHMTKGGLGWAVVEAGPVTVGALVAVNAGGDVLDEDGTVFAGTRVPGGAMAAIRERLAAGQGEEALREAVPPGGSTTLGLVATNAALTKGEVHRVAVQAHDGMARAIRPVHTSFDGDTVFALAVPRVAAAMDLVAFLAEEAVAAAIRAGVRAAGPVAGIPAASEVWRGPGGE